MQGDYNYRNYYVNWREYMKTKTLVFLIVFSFLMVGFSGCEELEESDPNYIVTTVTANINSEYFITETEGYPNVGVNVRVQII